MGMHEQTIKLIERQELCQAIKRYVQKFGLRAAERKYGINRYRLRKMLTFQKN